jgi:hypothetical protein
VVLHDVADRTDGVVKATAVGNVEIFGEGELHPLHRVAIPHRLEERVGKAKDEEVFDGFVAQEVIHSKDLLLGEGSPKLHVEFVC